MRQEDCKTRGSVPGPGLGRRQGLGEGQAGARAGALPLTVWGGAPGTRDRQVFRRFALFPVLSLSPDASSGSCI